MSYIDKNLLPNEQIVYRTKKHFIIFFTPMLWVIAALFFYVNPNPYVAKVTILPAVIALISWLNTLLTYITSDFVVTNKRIMMKEGFFIRHANEMRLSTISTVNITQGIIGQILNYGTLLINAFGGDADSFTEIAHAFEFQKQVQGQIDLLGQNALSNATKINN